MITGDKVLQFDYRGAPQTIQVMRRAALDSQSNLAVRQLAEAACERLDSKDYTSEYLALYNLLLQKCRYMRDPRTVELVRAPYLVAQEILQGGRPNLDCLPADTLLLKKGFTFCRLADIKPGDEIWGYDRWTTVRAVVYKGILPVDAVMLNNGSTFYATADHKAYVERCSGHPDRHDAKTHCAHWDAHRERVRLTVGELHPGMVLTQPERLPFGDGDMDPIWRLNTRSPAVGGSEKRLRVKEIERAVADVPVYDLETDDHYVYLPEADVTVSNCDDLSAMLAALVLAVGGNVRFVTVAFKNAFFNGQRQYSHVFAQALEPRTGLWIVLDPVAAEKTNEMMTRIKAAAVWPIA